jgi:hypothetical protein
MSTPSNQLQPTDAPLIQMRAGQRHAFRLIDQIRMLAIVARRQFGKTTLFGNIALKKMMRQKDHTVVFGSAKLNLSREIVRKEAGVIERGIAEATRRLAAGTLIVADAVTGKIPDRLTHDDFAEIFEAQRMEFRYYHSRNCYSRTKVVALRPDTVGETGDLMADEVGRIGNWRDVWEAIEPIVSSNPDYRLLLSTTPPPDDAHYSFEQLAPPPGTLFNVNAEGNLYESALGVQVLRVDVHDAYADGVPVYDLKTGAPLSPAAHRLQYPDKDAWDRNYGCLFVTGGTAAVGLMPLMDAQARGLKDGCVYAEDDLPDGWQALFTPGLPVGIGGDPATTENDKSNPFGIVCTQRVDGRFVARLVLSFKSSDPRKPKAILRELCRTLRPEALALDASGERYWCAEVAQELAAICPVLLIVNGEKTEYLGESMNFKTYLGNLAVNAIEDGEVSLPPARAVKDDFRLVKRFRGGFDNTLDSVTGRHGDLFDGFKLSLHAVLCGGGACEASATQIGERTAALTGRADGYTRMSMQPRQDEDQGRGSLTA